MLILSAEDVESVVTPIDMTTAMEQAFRIYATGDFTMPQRMHIDHHENTLLLMPCFSGEAFATKLVSFFPGNAAKGHPALYGTVILNDGLSGKPLALFNGARLTALRTAGVGGVGMLYSAGRTLTTAGVIGTGAQGYYQALFACALLPIKELFLYNRSPRSAEAFALRLRKMLPGVTVRVAGSSSELVASASLIITATNARDPVLSDDKGLLKGKHVVAIGSYKKDMQELPQALFSLVEKVYTDTDHACNETGDLIIPLQKGWLEEEQIVSIANLVTGEEEVSGDTTLFKSVGMALFDLVAAQLVYSKAREKGVGVEVEV